MSDPRSGRRCEQCGAAMPRRMHRQTNDRGAKVCEDCKQHGTPTWDKPHAAYATLGPFGRAEMRRREAMNLVAVQRVLSTTKVAHDGGDGATLNHCPFCGGGNVIGGSDGSVECGFCHTVFTVQVQPANPYTPQTVDGQSVDMPGMPQGAETDLATPDDPSALEPPVHPDEMNAPQPPQGPPGAPDAPMAPDTAQQTPAAPTPPGVAPPAKPEEEEVDENGKPKQKKPQKGVNPFAKKTSREDIANMPIALSRLRQYAEQAWSETRGGYIRDLEGDLSWLDGLDEDDQRFNLGEMLDNHGITRNMILTKMSTLTPLPANLSRDNYIARLALSHADNRQAVLDRVRIRRTMNTPTRPDNV